MGRHTWIITFIERVYDLKKKICVTFADGFDITQIRYKWIGVSLYSKDMAEFYIMNQTLSSDKVKYIIGQ